MRVLHDELRDANAATFTEPEQICYHCLQPLDSLTVINVTIEGVEHPVCCYGCRSAAEFINQENLTEFYQRRDRTRDRSIAPFNSESQPVVEDWTFLDMAETSKDYVDYAEDGSRVLKLSVQGVYCTSCSWLISKTLKEMSNTIHATIDVAAKYLVLKVDDGGLKLSEVVSVIDQLGYRPQVLKLNSDWEALTAKTKQEQRNSLKRMAVAGLGMMQVMTYAVALYFGEFQGIEPEFARFLTLISLLVATVVVFYSGQAFFKNAWNDIKLKHAGMDVPIALAIAGAYFPSVYITLLDKPGHVYFDSAVMFIFFLSLGRYVEMRARQRLSTSPAVITNLLPPFIKIQRADSELTIKPTEVIPNDLAQVYRLQRIPFDGVINVGEASLNEAQVTGESIPVHKKPGDFVYAGSVLVNGKIELKATRSWQGSSLANIERLLDKAKSVDDQNQTYQAAQRFVLFVLIMTVLVGGVWWAFMPGRVLDIVLAMLVASCPCAFALATPLGKTAAAQALRAKGILLTKLEALSLIPKVDLWCFDKTGTLTQGRPTIVRVTPHFELTEDDCLRLAASLEKNGQHTFSQAFNISDALQDTQNIERHPGLGVSGKIVGKRYYLGKPDWVANKVNDPIETKNQSSSSTVISLTSETAHLADFYIEDKLRSGIRDTIEHLTRQHAQALVLSGDQAATVAKITQELPLLRSVGDQLPEQKQAIIAGYQASGKIVAMVGDGVNDAPAIAQADIRIAMSSGSELSQTKADIIIMNGRISSLLDLQRIAKNTQNITRQNLRWALVYNAIALPLAAMGFLTPWLAALGMSFSSLLVVLNALRITKTQQKTPIKRGDLAASSA